MAEYQIIEFNDGYFYAVPEAVATTIAEHDSLTLAPPTGAVRLDTEEETAERLFALRLHLDDWAVEIVAGYDDKTFRVNPHAVYDGTSPEEALQRVGLLRAALGKIKDKSTGLGIDAVRDHMFQVPNKGTAWTLDTISVADLTIENLKAIGYEKLARWLQQDAAEDLKISLIGPHDVINTLYFLTTAPDPHDHAAGHRATIGEAWVVSSPQGVGGQITDRRKRRETQDTEWAVYTESEANEEWDRSLDSYLDECVLSELHESVHRYFDREKWKMEARTDGRAQSISRYDGIEHEVETGHFLNKFVIVREG